MDPSPFCLYDGVGPVCRPDSIPRRCCPWPLPSASWWRKTIPAWCGSIGASCPPVRVSSFWVPEPRRGPAPLVPGRGAGGSSDPGPVPGGGPRPGGAGGAAASSGGGGHPGGLLGEPSPGGAGGLQVVGGEPVRVIARARDQSPDGAGLGVDRDDRALASVQAVPGGALGLGVQGGLDGRAARGRCDRRRRRAERAAPAGRPGRRPRA